MVSQLFSYSKHGLLAILFALGFSLATVEQAAAACSSTITPADRTHGYGATTAKVSVATSSGCNWTVVNNTSWITILSGTSGTGSKDVTYALEGNPNPGTRQGVIQIAGKNFTVTQSGVQCTYEISPTFHNKCPNSSTGSVQVSTPSPCPWTVFSPVDWIVITDGENSVGSGKVFFTVLDNLGPTPRTAVLTIAGLPFTINQAAFSSFTCAPDKQFPCGSSWDFDAPTGQGSSPQIVSTTTNTICGGSYLATRVWSVSDACGNPGLCTQVVTVVDQTPPVLICAPGKSVDCNGAWNFDEPTASDGCDPGHPGIGIASTITNQNGACGFSATRTWIAVDACGNASTCSQTVTMVDNTPPTISCAGAKSAECGAGWSFDPPTATDACSGPATIHIVTTMTNHNGFCGGTFSATRIWRATDACGNISLCSQIVTVVDTLPPQLSCAPAQAVVCGSPWAFTPPAVIDLCQGTDVPLRVISTVTNGHCGQTLTAIRTWEAEDACGNKSTCSQTVTVASELMQVTCAPDRSVNCAEVWSFDPPTAQGGCGAVVRAISATTNRLCGSAFVATQVWEISNGCTNMLCLQTITVVDNPPVVVCAWNRLVPCDMAWTFEEPQVTDDCGYQVRIVGTVTNVLCGRSYSATRIWEIEDGCTNIICSQTIDVLDQTPPTIVCPPDITVTNLLDVPHCAKSFTEFVLGGGQASDSCDTFRYRCIEGSLVEVPCGYTIERLHTVMDTCGNSNSCVQRITIVTCPPVAQRPVLSEISILPTGGIKLKITGPVGQSYHVLRGTELGKPWNVIGTVALDGYGFAEFVDPTGISGPCRMYRLVEP